MSIRSEAEAARWLLSAAAVRARARQFLALADADRLPHLKLNRDRLAQAVDEVLAATRADYPTLDIPYHSPGVTSRPAVAIAGASLRDA